MMSSTRPWLPMALSGFFLILDQLLKWLSLNSWNNPNLLTPYFGWQPFVNAGIAFGIRLPAWSVILVSAPILLLIAAATVKKYRNNKESLLFGWTVLFSGALSNFIDRLVYNNVVDYFLLGISLINLADAMIVAGLGIIVWENWREKMIKE